MSEKLINTELETSENRTARTDYQCGSGSHQGSGNRHGPRCRPDSLTPPSRARQSDHQGAQFASVRLGRYSPATVVALRTGGASRSKWTRKTRPWNASLRTTVVAFVSIEEPRLENSECMPTHPGSRHQRRSPASRSEAMAGFLREIPATKLPKVGSRITAPPSGVRLGGGDRKTPFVVTESMRRRCEWHR